MSPITVFPSHDPEGWMDYYRNLTEFDFKLIPAMNQMRHSYWAHNEGTQDLYYRGWKKEN